MEFRDVGVESRQQVPGAGAGEEAGGEPLEAPVDGEPEIEESPGREPYVAIARVGGQHQAADLHGGHEHRELEQQQQIAAQQRVVEQWDQEQRPELPREPGEQRKDENPREPPPIGKRQAERAPVDIGDGGPRSAVRHGDESCGE